MVVAQEMSSSAVPGGVSSGVQVGVAVEGLVDRNTWLLKSEIMQNAVVGHDAAVVPSPRSMGAVHVGVPAVGLVEVRTVPSA